MLSAANEDFRVKFPLHFSVWSNDYRLLESQLFQNDIESVDPRGRTPLHLAVSLGHLESVRVLLRHGAEVTKENANNWTVLQEAVSTGDPEMVQLVLQRRDYLKASTALGGVPELLSRIRQSPDFYMEMKWEFTSWIPLVSRVCPSDVCRIWKSGASLRVDATLLGFENMTWIRGRRSYIFRGDDTCTELMEVNHDEEVVDTERFDISREIEDVTMDSMQPAEQEVAKRLTTPIVNTFLDTKLIAFERNKCGIWGWRTDKTEVVNGFESKVFTVNNVNVVIRTRTEHLTDEEKARIKSERNVLESLLGTVEQQINAQGDLTLEFATATNPTAITPEEYFDPDFDLEDRDIGRPIELSIRTQKFKGTLWMSEDHPLSLVEQVTPIIDLMARTSTHFARLRDFVTLKFPPGFPVKIEIPLFHVLNARITFGNVNKCSTAESAETPPSATTPSATTPPATTPPATTPPATTPPATTPPATTPPATTPPATTPSATTPSATTPSPTDDGEAGAPPPPAPPPFRVCPSVFVVPPHYRLRGGSRHAPVSSNDEELLQYAIHQSLLDTSGSPAQELNWENANGDFAEPQSSVPRDRSNPEGALVDLGDGFSSGSSRDVQLRLAIELSARAQLEEQKRRKEEEEELERILQLSLTEK